MKFIASLFILLLLTCFSIYIAVAQAPEKMKARAVLLRTNRVIGVAHAAVKRNKVYTGDLSKAVRHERYARKLYRKDMFIKAIHHSRKARNYATLAIKANKATPPAESVSTKDEDALAGVAPSDKEMEDELAKEMPDNIKDEDLLPGNLDINPDK